MKQRANQQKQLRNNVHVKTGPSAKKSYVQQEMKIDPKSDLCPFCTIAFHFEKIKMSKFKAHG